MRSLKRSEGRKNQSRRSAKSTGTHGGTGADEKEGCKEGGEEKEGGWWAGPQNGLRRKHASVSSKTRKNMVQWRSINQEGMDNVWKVLCGKMADEVLEKYNVEENKKGACKGRGKPLKWRIVQRVKKYQPRKVGEDCWARIYSRLREYS